MIIKGQSGPEFTDTEMVLLGQNAELKAELATAQASYTSLMEHHEAQTKDFRKELAAIKSIVKAMAPFVRSGWTEDQEGSVGPDYNGAVEILENPIMVAILKEGE